MYQCDIVFAAIRGEKNVHVGLHRTFVDRHRYAQNPLHTFPRNFPVDGEVADLLRTCYRETDVMNFGH